MHLHLTKPQLRELTGTAIAARQLLWLDRNHWIYVIDAKGGIKVAMAYFEKRMGVRDDAPASAMPDWSSFTGLPSPAKAA